MVYATMAFLALLAHNCHISMADSKLNYLMYIIFFRGKFYLLLNIYKSFNAILEHNTELYFHFFLDRKCGYINWNIVADVPPAQEPTWPAVTAVAYRTNILMLVYFVLSALMIVTSLMIIGNYTT